MARLWIAIEGKKKVWKIPAAGVVIGGAGAQLKLEDALVADKHCRLEPAGDGWRVKLLDDGATMLVSGESVTEADLGNGDVITIGDTEIHYEVEGAAASPARSSAPAGRRSGGGGGRRSGGGSRRSAAPAARVAEGSRVGSARRDKYANQQSTPEWVTWAGIAGAVALVGILGYFIITSMGPNVKPVLDGALEAAMDGDFDKAYERLNKVKPPIAPQALWQEYKDKIDAEKDRWDNQARELHIQSMFEARVQKYSTSSKVIRNEPINVYQLLIRVELFKHEYQGSKWVAEAEKIASKYRGVVDMNNPDPAWLVTAVHDPYYKSQHHKKFYMSFNMIDFLRTKYGGQFSEVLDGLYGQTVKFERMYAERELKDAAALLKKKERFVPKVKAQMVNLDRVISYVKHQEWKDKATAARAEMQKYLETLFD